MAVFSSAFTKVNNLLGLTAPGFAEKSASIPVVPTAQQFLSSVQRIVGDDDSHVITNPTLRFSVLYDTYIYENSPTFGFAGATFLSIGYSTARRRGLVYFDLSSITGLSVDSAHLWLYNTNNSSTLGNGTLQAYRVMPANSGWTEGGFHIGTTASGLEPSWNKKTQSPSADWAGSAGLLTSGTDHSATLMGSAGWTDGVAGWMDLNLNTSETETMLANNAGIMLKGSDETSSGHVVIPHSKENTAGSQYIPYLEITLGTLTADSSSVLLVADDVGATWSNTPVADANSAPISTVWMELPLTTLGAADFAMYVPTGVNVWYAILGPK